MKIATREDCTKNNKLCKKYPNTGEVIQESNTICNYCSRPKEKTVKDRYEG